MYGRMMNKITYVTTRRQDSALADVVGDFMDEYFYSKLGEKWKRVSDAKLQKRGVDVLFGDCKIDEKVKIKGGFANTLLEYPSFELSFVNRYGKRQLGWFLDPNSLTDYYAMIAVFGDFKDETGVAADTIRYLNVLFVKKQDIYDYIILNGVDVESGVRILETPGSGDRIDHPGTGMHMKLSDRFSEQPINLVVKRSYLYELPNTREFEVYRNRIEDTRSRIC